MQEQIQKHFESFSNDGFRTIGIAYKNLSSESPISKDDEKDMTFLGFLTLFDPPKANIADTIAGPEEIGRFSQSYHW